MDDRSLYQTILGLEAPWYVNTVEVRTEDEEVWVFLERDEQQDLVCPECGRVCPGYDRSPERRWRHLDTCQYHTVLVARIPRVQCPEHGVRQITIPWGENRSRFTALFEATAIRLLQETTLLGLTRIMGLSWDEAEGIMRRAVARGLARREEKPVRLIGVDETSFQKRHEYVTVVSDLERSCVQWVGDGRGKETLEQYWASVSEEQKGELEYVVLDMWEAYITATTEALPDGDERIVFDHFHVVKHLNDAVDRVRRAEHRKLREMGDERLTGTKHALLKGQRRRKRRDWATIRKLRNSGLKVGRAWAIKEAALKLWTYRSATWARKHFDNWYFWATHSRLDPIIKAAKMMKRHLKGILNYIQSGATNATAEAINSKIQEIKYRARGYRNRANFRMAIMFHCGGLDMNPR
jgi:transposase